MVTGNELILQVRDILDEPVAAQWSDEQLLRWINEGNRDLARSTRHLKDTLTLPTLAGFARQPVSPDVLAIEHAWWRRANTDARYEVLSPRQPESMELIHGGDIAHAGIPEYFTTEGVSPNLNIVFWPVPDKAGSLRLIVSRLPAMLTDPAQNIEIPAAWYDALADYCEAKALRRDRDQRWAEAFRFYTEKRDALINNIDYMPVAREMIPDVRGGYLPSWLVEFD